MATCCARCCRNSRGADGITVRIADLVDRGRYRSSQGHGWLECAGTNGIAGESVLGPYFRLPRPARRQGESAVALRRRGMSILQTLERWPFRVAPDAERRGVDERGTAVDVARGD